MTKETLENIASTMPCIDVDKKTFDSFLEMVEKIGKPYRDDVETFIK